MLDRARSPSATTGSAGTTSPTRNTAICCCRSTPRASTTPARCRSSISISTAAASTWRRRCSRRCCRSICSRRGGCSAPRSALPASPSPGGSAAAIGGPLAGLARARAARRLPALLRPHVHQSEGRAVRRGDGAVPARPRPPARSISEALPDHAVHRRPRLRSLDRLAHHGGLRRARSDRRAGAAVCDRGARRWPARGGPPASACSLLAAHPERHPRLCGDGADLAVGRGQSAQPASMPSKSSRISSRSPGTSCSTAR